MEIRKKNLCKLPGGWFPFRQQTDSRPEARFHTNEDYRDTFFIETIHTACMFKGITPPHNIFILLYDSILKLLFRLHVWVLLLLFPFSFMPSCWIGVILFFGHTMNQVKKIKIFFTIPIHMHAFNSNNTRLSQPLKNHELQQENGFAFTNTIVSRLFCNCFDRKFVYVSQCNIVVDLFTFCLNFLPSACPIKMHICYTYSHTWFTHWLNTAWGIGICMHVCASYIYAFKQINSREGKMNNDEDDDKA